jgi:cytochrome c-type biogenesis protein CcmE
MEPAMTLLPRSRTARRRLMAVAAAAPILVLAAGLVLYGLRDSISYFYTPAQALAAHVEPGRSIQLGGLVLRGSVSRSAGGETDFTVADRAAQSRVSYKGALPDLFREGQGIVAVGAYDRGGVFIASQVLAKHDEKYMPRELAQALKAQGEWRGNGASPAYAAASTIHRP